MSVTTTMQKVVNGPIKVTLEANKEALSLFQARPRNDLVRTCLQIAGEGWISIFLPQRFSNYAKKLGYHVTSRTLDRKRRLYGHDTPFVQTTEMQNTVMSRATSTATAKSGGGVIVIRLPFGHALPQEFVDVFRSLPAWEVNKLNEIVVREIAAELNGATYSSDAKGDTRATRSVFRPTAAAPAPRRRATAPSRVA